MQQRGRRSREQWQQILSTQQRSGLSVAAFCRRHQLGVSNFYNWRARLSLGEALSPVAGEASSFIDLGQLNGGDMAQSCGDVERWDFELDFGNGMALKFRRR